jgi:hypothetical protein
MSSTMSLLSQAATEYGALAARDAFLTVKQQISSFGATELAIAVAAAVGLYLLVKHL